MSRRTTNFRHAETTEFHKILSELTNRGHNLARVFEDFLSATVCAFSTGQLEERYMEIAGRYGEHMNTMGEALGALVMAMQETGVDHRCVMMTAINLALNYRRGKVVWGNSLSLQEHGHYSIFRFSGLVQVLWSERPVLTVKKAEEMVVIDDDERAEAKKPQQLSLIDAA
jgi:hypothetical protein